MSPTLRGVKADEAIKAFLKAGGVLRPGKGSHRTIKMPDGQLITIPDHGEVKIGLLLAAIKKVGITVDEFLGLLGRK